MRSWPPHFVLCRVLAYHLISTEHLLVSLYLLVFSCRPREHSVNNIASKLRARQEWFRQLRYKCWNWISKYTPQIILNENLTCSLQLAAGNEAQNFVCNRRLTDSRGSTDTLEHRQPISAIHIRKFHTDSTTISKKSVFLYFIPVYWYLHRQ